MVIFRFTSGFQWGVWQPGLELGYGLWLYNTLPLIYPFTLTMIL